MPYGYWYNQSGLGCDRRGGMAGIARGFGDDYEKGVAAGSLLLYSVTFNSVDFGVNWGFNWLGSGTCRDAIVRAIRATESFNSVSVIPGNFTDNNCVQAQIQLVTSYDWDLGSMRDLLDNQLIGAGFQVNTSNLTVQRSGASGASNSTGTPIGINQNPDGTQKGLFDDFVKSLGVSQSTLMLGAVILTLVLLKK